MSDVQFCLSNPRVPCSVCWIKLCCFIICGARQKITPCCKHKSVFHVVTQMISIQVKNLTEFYKFNLTTIGYMEKKILRSRSGRNRSVTTATLVPCRGNERCGRDAMGNALRDKSWSTCEINPRCNWVVRAGDFTNQEAIKPAQTKVSLA